MGIPLEQGGVFRLYVYFFTKQRYSFQSLWNRAGSFDDNANTRVDKSGEFQSLWNRAWSFDKNSQQVKLLSFVSIPLEQGGVFRLLIILLVLKSVLVSIPLKQGGVF